MAEFLFAPSPNKEAAAFIAGKPAVSRAVFKKLLPELKARAFTIAGIQNADVLQRARDLIADLPAGGDWNEIKRGLLTEISPYFADESASAEDQAKQQNAAERRAELLIRTHGQQAYATAQHGLLEAQRDLLPYWQYLSLGDGNVRDTHKALDGIVLPADHEFWQTHFPPWDWGCRCQVVPLTRADVVEIAAQEKGKPKDAQNVLGEYAQGDLTKTRRLVRNGVTFNLTAPREEGKAGAFTFHPADLRISPDKLKERYDPEVFGAFEKWARRQILPDAGGTVWQWMSGEPGKK
jgi:SPP1 gp7 family putative phage head morphogenesis protein